MSPHAASDLCVRSLSLSTIHKVVQFLQVLQRNSNVRLSKLVPSLHILHVKPWVTLYLEFLSKPITWEQTMETIRSRRIISYHRGLWKQQEKSMYPKVIFFLRDTHFSTIFQASVTGYATPLYRFSISIIVYRK